MTDRLLELEEGFWKAAGNGEYYREHMAPEGLCVLPVGVLGRDETAAAIEESEPWVEFKLHDVRPLDLSDDAASCATEQKRSDTTIHSATCHRHRHRGATHLIYRQMKDLLA